MKMFYHSVWKTVLFCVFLVIILNCCDTTVSETVRDFSTATSLIDEVSEKLSTYLINNVDNKTSIKEDLNPQETSSTIIKSIKDNAETIQVAKNETTYIDAKQTNNDNKRSKNRRDTQKVKDSPLRELRKQINGRNKIDRKSESIDRRPELQSDARLEPNYTFPAKLMTYDFGTNYEQNFNKQNNKLWQLNELRKSMKDTSYVLLTGIECTFEKACIWKWTNDAKDGFQVASPQNYGLKDTGPVLDADNNTDGEFIPFFNLFLRCTVYRTFEI